MTAWKVPTLWKYAARQMWRRPGRTLLTLLGIAVGVATMVAVSLTIQATRRAYRDMFESVSGRASLEVVAEGLGGFDERVADWLGPVSGVKAALPVVQTSAALVGPSGPVPVLVLGVDPTKDGAARDYVLREGRPLGEVEGILLEAGFAEAQGLGLGRSARLWAPSGISELPVIGLLEARGPAAFNGGAITFMSLATAQRLFALERQVNSVQIVLTDGADPNRVEAALGDHLPPDLLIQPPRARGERAHSAMYSMEQALTGMSMASLVAGAFVILNTFHMNLAERRRQLAILRALGATRAQVTRLLVREALLLGMGGAALGAVAGLVLATALVRGMEHVMGNVRFPDLRLTAETILLALVFGPGTALVASFLPARRAARRDPLEDLQPCGAARGDDIPRWPCYAGLALAAAHLALVVVITRGWLPASLFSPVMSAGIVGSVLALPLALPLLLRFAGGLLKPLLGLEGRLAFRQVERHRTRTALTVGILAVAVLVGIGVGHAILASLRDIQDWSDRVAGADFYLRGTIPDGAYAITAAALPEGLERELATLDGVERVDKVSWVPARAEGQQVAVLACTFAPDRLPLDLVEGEASAVRRSLLQGEVVLGTALARRLGRRVGDEVVLETRRGPRALRVAGIANEYTLDGMALYLEWGTARDLFKVEGAHLFAVTAEKGRASSLAPRLRSYSEAHGLLFQTRADLRDYVDRAVGGFANLMWALLALVFVVSSLGVVNTLTMNVLEQTRELGVLRAIGLRRGQLLKLVLSEALALGVISLVPGLLLGIGLGYWFNLLYDLLLAHPVAFRIELPLILGCLALSVTVTLLAALFPARRAARLPVTQALHYE